MITRIKANPQDFEGQKQVKVDPATQVDDFFDYSKVIVKKPWGYEYLLFQNGTTAIWILYIKRNFQSSMHCHAHKKTSLIVLSGEATSTTFSGVFKLGVGDGLLLEKGVFHTTRADSENGIFLMEIETPVNKRDVLRLSDLYGRANTGYEGKEHYSYNTHNYNYLKLGLAEAYYENTKKFGRCSIKISRFASTDDFVSKLSKENSDVVSVLSGEIKDSSGNALMGAGDMLSTGSLGGISALRASPGIELIQIKRRDSMVRLSDYAISLLEKNGIVNFFVIGGQANSHLLDALAKNNHIIYLPMQHEQAAIMAAQACAKLSGRPAAGMVSSGSSSASAVSGVAGAWTSSTPIIVISGQAKLKETIGKSGVRQLGINEINIVDMVRPITKYAVMLDDPSQVRYEIEKAIWHATTGRPGPVWIDIPFDLQSVMIDEDSLAGFAAPAKIDGVKAAKDDLSKVASLLASSKRPVILAGNGIRISRAEPRLLALAESLGVPVVTSINGKDLMDGSHPLLFGVIGGYGNRAANFVIQNSDMVISIGSRLSVAEISCRHEHFARAATKVVVDIDPAEVAKPTIKPDIAIVMDAGRFIDGMASFGVKPQAAWGKWIARCNGWKESFGTLDSEKQQRDGFVDIYRFISSLSSLASEKDIVCLDRGTSFYSTVQAFKVKMGQRIISSSGLLSSGFGLPGAIGACTLHPEGSVISICGDGGIQLSLQELETVAHYRLPVKLFIIDNKGHSTLRKTQKAYLGGRFVAADAESGKGFPDMEKVALAFGIRTYRLKGNSDVGEKLPGIFASSAPFLCVVEIDPEQQIEPRLVSTLKQDGTLISRPLEDMYPFLSRQELKKNMIVDTIEED